MEGLELEPHLPQVLSHPEAVGHSADPILESSRPTTEVGRDLRVGDEALAEGVLVLADEIEDA